MDNAIDPNDGQPPVPEKPEKLSELGESSSIEVLEEDEDQYGETFNLVVDPDSDRDSKTSHYDSPPEKKSSAKSICENNDSVASRATIAARKRSFGTITIKRPQIYRTDNHLDYAQLGMKIRKVFEILKSKMANKENDIETKPGNRIQDKSGNESRAVDLSWIESKVIKSCYVTFEEFENDIKKAWTSSETPYPFVEDLQHLDLRERFQDINIVNISDDVCESNSQKGKVSAKKRHKRIEKKKTRKEDKKIKKKKRDKKDKKSKHKKSKKHKKDKKDKKDSEKKKHRRQKKIKKSKHHKSSKSRKHRKHRSSSESSSRQRIAKSAPMPIARKVRTKKPPIPLSYEEKQELSMQINMVLSEFGRDILRIISPDHSDEHGELEFSIDDLDPATARNLQKFVKAKLKQVQNRKRPKKQAVAFLDSVPSMPCPVQPVTESKPKPKYREVTMQEFEEDKALKDQMAVTKVRNGKAPPKEIDEEHIFSESAFMSDLDENSLKDFF